MSPVCGLVKTEGWGRGTGLEGLVASDDFDLEQVDGVDTTRAKEIREGLRRLQEVNFVDRFLHD